MEVKKLTLVVFVTLFGYSCFFNQSINYPVSKKVEQVDNYFGVKVEDPYRWLEDDNSSETNEWVKAQNEVTFNYLEKIPFREKIKQRLTEIWDYEKYGQPFKEGDNYYFYKNDGLQEQYVVYRQKDLDGNAEVFIDPHTFSKDNTIRLRGLYFSKDYKYCGYGVTNSGSDWREFFVMNADTKEKLRDHLQWIKFSGMAWYKDGFFYSRYDEPKENEKLKASNEYQKLFYHKLGTKQAEDLLIYQDTANPKYGFGSSVTEDEKHLVISVWKGTSKNMVSYKDLENDSEIVPLIDSFYADHYFIDNTDDGFLFMTNHGATNYKLVLIDPENPSEDHWKTIIPAQEFVMSNVNFVSGKLIVNYLKDAITLVSVYTHSGEKLYDIDLPGVGTVWGFSGKRKDREVFYTFSSYTQPPTIYKYDIIENKSTLLKKPKVNFDIDNFETKQVFYPSKDGTKIPLFITYKKGIDLKGNNPALLSGYGGFQSPVRPYFSLTIIPLLEKGFIYCVAGLRGGNEYGEEWHKAGMLENKQNVFDDFIYAAKYLFDNGYSSPDKIGIRGASNGGLLVGACMTQKPEMFKVALPDVGVLDMLRFHKFTIGHAWVAEYGSSEDKTQFEYLHKYSPLHNLKIGKKYPATLISTADHDDRVFPAHSFKFAATLQEKSEGINPILIRIETNIGHGTETTSKIINKYTDFWSFLLYNVDVDFKE
ncbi:MAG: S9 family peptidase [Candidatus Marinimicrobia bacterium]|nr:S9 family peptidase [Candidatus Neomarinimicrobiota bacterium]